MSAVNPGNQRSHFLRSGARRDDESDKRGKSVPAVAFRETALALLLVGCIVVSTTGIFLGSTTAVAATNTSGPVEGSVELDVDPDDDEFESGQEGTLDLLISNDGEVLTNGTHPDDIRDRVTRAESTDIEITDAPAEIDVRTGEQSVGDIESGETALEPFDIFVEDDATPGEYDLEVTVSYTNVTVTEYEQNDDGEVVAVSEDRTDDTDTFTVTIEVESEPAFDVVDIEENVQIDETGEFTVVMENTGGEDAEDVVVTAEASDQDIFFGSGGPSSERSVGDWEAFETKAITFEAGATDSALTEPYPIDLTVDFTDEVGEDGVDTTQTEIEPQDRQQFVVDGPEHDVSIGDDGLVELEVKNAGPKDITNASVTIQTNDAAITFPEADGGATTAETFVDNWEAGETKQIVLRTAVGSDAVERNYTMEAVIDARDAQDNQLNERNRPFGFEPEPKQRYTVERVDHSLTVGDDARVDIDLRNHGPQNVTESTVTLTTGDSSLTFEDGTTTTEIFVGDWERNETKTVTTRLGASDDAVETSYTIDAAIDARDGDDSGLATREREFGIEPLPRQQYSIAAVDHDVPVDDDGVLELELANHGQLNLTEASVEITANDPAISFGSGTGEAVEVGDAAFETGDAGSPSSEAYVGDWEANETKTVFYRVSASEDALQRNYTLEATVAARNEDDERLSERTREFGFEPLSEQRFGIENTETSLRVGEDGDIVGAVRNEGDRPVESVVVLLDNNAETVLPRETQYAIGDLEPGERAEFDFRVGISEEAEPGPRVFEFETRYRNANGDIRLDDSQDIFVEVAPKRDAFEVRPVSATFEPGESDTVEMELTNNLDEPVENVRAKVFPDSPVSSDNDETFVSALAPGETETVVFELGVESGAVPKEYPVSLDIRYDDERGDRQLSGTYEVAVEVVEESDEGLSWWLLGVVLLVVGVLVLYFRDQLSTAFGRLASTARGT